MAWQHIAWRMRESIQIFLVSIQSHESTLLKLALTIVRSTRASKFGLTSITIGTGVTRTVTGLSPVKIRLEVLPACAMAISPSRIVADALEDLGIYACYTKGVAPESLADGSSDQVRLRFDTYDSRQNIDGLA